MASDTAETTINVLATIATACIFISMIPGMYIVHKKRIHGLGDLDHAFSSVGAVNYLGAVFGVIFSGIFILHEKEHRKRYVIFFCGVFALIIALLLYRP
ncbi:hypothetical protein GQ600_14857 [Phytophthora cactorum]|nr:hypothetical protein GQ600_14857 [Phytophthora cactorum]